MKLIFILLGKILETGLGKFRIHCPEKVKLLRNHAKKKIVLTGKRKMGRARNLSSALVIRKCWEETEVPGARKLVHRQQT